MIPVQFPEAMVTLAKDQPEYQPLPVHITNDAPYYTTTSCWQLSWKERFKAFWTGRVWLQQLTFAKPLQPQRPSIDKPELPL